MEKLATFSLILLTTWPTSVAPNSTSNINSIALTTGLQRRAWKRPTCTRMQKCSGAYGVGGMQALDPLDQWQGRGRIKQAPDSASSISRSSGRMPSAAPDIGLPGVGLGGFPDRLLANCL